LIFSHQNASFITLISLILKRSVSYFEICEFCYWIDRIFATNVNPACPIAFAALRKFIRLSEEKLMFVSNSGLLKNALKFLESEEFGFVGGAVSLFEDVLKRDCPEAIQKLGSDGLISALYHPFRFENECLQTRAAALLIRMLAADRGFLEIALESRLVECLCEMAANSGYRLREKAVRALCEIFYCDHNLDAWQRIAEAGGIASLIDCLTDLKPKRAMHVMHALSHLLSVQPNLIESFQREIYEVLDFIENDEINEGNGELKMTARGLNADLMEVFGNEM
jgi:hypothetical protein